MKSKSVKINAILNIIKTCVSIVFPLVTFPYVSRVLGVENLGKVNYGLSIVSYFSLFAALGINVYAIREGSKIRDNKEEFIIFANEIFALNMFTTLVSYIGLFLILLIFDQLRPYSVLILIQSISIFFTTLGVDWINTIYEDYLIITIRTILTYIISLILLFILVKTKSDYYMYAIITVMSNAFVCVFNNIYCRKYLRLRFVKISFDHLKKALVFFANNVAIQIYVSIDVTMLGTFTDAFCVGIYSTAVKVYSIVKSALAAIYTVAISRLSFYVGKKDYISFKNTLTELTSYITLILLPSIVGLIMVSDDIILILSGQDYISASITLKILSIALLFAIYGGLINNCINIPLGNEKVIVKATSFSAMINLVLNFFMIPMFKQNGAAITTVLSELIVCVYCLSYNKNLSDIINVHRVKRITIQSVFGSLGIMLIICFINFISKYSIISFVVKVISSIIVYIVILILLKNKETIEIINKIKTKLLIEKEVLK